MIVIVTVVVVVVVIVIVIVTVIVLVIVPVDMRDAAGSAQQVRVVLGFVISTVSYLALF